MDMLGTRLAAAGVPVLPSDNVVRLAPAGTARDAALAATFDATHLAAGVYEANICVRSNDLANRIVGVPVKFTVTTNEAIFTSGFDD